jgi:adenine-specific DNA-methyltransferase
LQLGASKSAKVLDFFAGSGTTLHAVMALNAEDGGSRECILVTNNENNICEEVTYERNKRVIQGYSPLTPNGGTKTVVGLSGNNLRYYQTGYVGREKTLANKRALMALATEMLCLKEGVYEEINLLGFENLTGLSLGVRLFRANDRAFMVVYDDTYIPQAVSIIQAVSAEFESNGLRLKVYVFSEGQDPYTEDFEEVAEWVQLVALPDAIYRAFQHLLPSPPALRGSDPNGGINNGLTDNE